MLRSAAAAALFFLAARAGRRGPVATRAPRRSLFIQTESTPNEHALKFIPGMPVATGGAVHEFTSPQQAARSPLAAALFAVEGVASVFFGPDFVSVTKTPAAQWRHLKPLVYAALMDQFSAAGRPLVVAPPPPAADTGAAEEPEVVQMIKELLETRIRPAIQSDGGDVEYRGFENGYVRLKLQGACRTCTSSALTLRTGIENMLMHYIPEVRGIEQVADAEETASEDAFAQLERDLKRK